jgi:serine/threonine-protein kinase RIO1
LKRHKKKEEVQKWLRMEEENAEQLQLKCHQKIEAEKLLRMEVEAPIVLASLKNINKRNVIDDIGCSDSSVGKVAKAYGGGTDHQRLNGT